MDARRGVGRGGGGGGGGGRRRGRGRAKVRAQSQSFPWTKFLFDIQQPAYCLSNYYTTCNGRDVDGSRAKLYLSISGIYLAAAR